MQCQIIIICFLINSFKHIGNLISFFSWFVTEPLLCCAKHIEEESEKYVCLCELIAYLSTDVFDMASEHHTARTMKQIWEKYKIIIIIMVYLLIMWSIHYLTGFVQHCNSELSVGLIRRECYDLRQNKMNTWNRAHAALSIGISYSNELILHSYNFDVCQQLLCERWITQ